ncbi:MAG TPA: GNAT family N-acetyltransferase [Rubrivivax sp.]|nr:GNAT family N-acetyltransferase [Rubrivivax sp.]
MNTSSITIRPMTRAEIDLGIDWAAAEGWNPGLHDAESFYAADPGGFLVGLLDNEPVGMISAVKYGHSFGFIGFYIVRPAFRGRRHGLALWQAGMQALSGRRVGLDGVVAQQDNYRRSGFVLAYNNVRYEGVPCRSAKPDKAIVPLTQVPFDEVLRYDSAFFPDERAALLGSWIAQRSSIALGVVRDRGLAGYGVIRPCRAGFKVGPLFADDAKLADRLFRALVAQVPHGSPVQLDIPAVNSAALELVAAHGMAPVFETARMYTGAAPALAIDRLFGVTTFELG